jgi:hypothetical protein
VRAARLERRLRLAAGSGGIETGDRFGEELAAGDFNGDARLDLAIGHPLENRKEDDEGYVTVLYASSLGVTNASRREFWHQGRRDVPGEPEEGDRLGSALAAGDFDGDGVDDLAIGVPMEDFEHFPRSDVNAGRVLVAYGSPGGLRIRSGGVSDWDRDSVGVQSSREDQDRFGAGLGVGDFNHDGVADLIVGVPGGPLHMTTGERRFSAGVAQILYGARQGLSTLPELGRQTVHGGRDPARPIHAEIRERFGERFLR